MINLIYDINSNTLFLLLLILLRLFYYTTFTPGTAFYYSLFGPRELGPRELGPRELLKPSPSIQ